MGGQENLPYVLVADAINYATFPSLFSQSVQSPIAEIET